MYKYVVYLSINPYGLDEGYTKVNEQYNGKLTFKITEMNTNLFIYQEPIRIIVRTNDHRTIEV